MNKNNPTLHLLSFFMLMTIILSACGKEPNPTLQTSPTGINSTTPIPAVMTFTTTPLPTETATLTPIPLQRLQLTYSIQREGIDQIYAIPIQCPDNTPPCMGEAILLFEFDSPIIRLNWSPDGKRVVFEAIGVGGKDDVFIADWNGDNLMNVTNSPEYEGAPVWSPDGSRIGYIGCSAHGGNCKFITINPEGTDPIQLIDSLSIALLTAVWSPDKTKILFSGSILEPFDQIYLANLDGSGLIKLTDDDTGHYSQIFSPRGDWIAFAQTHDPEEVDWSDIFLIRPDGSDKTNLTNGLTTFQSDIAWAPSGNWIAFSGSINNKYDIYIIHPDGKDFIKATNEKGNIGNPAWRLSYGP